MYSQILYFSYITTKIKNKN